MSSELNLITLYIWWSNVSLFMGLLFYVPSDQEFFRMWRRHHYRLRAKRFRSMLDVQGLWAGRDLYRATSAGTLVFWSHPPHSVTSYDKQGDAEDLFYNLDLRGSPFSHFLRLCWNDKQFAGFFGRIVSSRAKMCFWLKKRRCCAVVLLDTWKNKPGVYPPSMLSKCLGISKEF
jgi:hypothetical protein